jgi:hypothetical protein
MTCSFAATVFLLLCRHAQMAREKEIKRPGGGIVNHKTRSAQEAIRMILIVVDKLSGLRRLEAR